MKLIKEIVNRWNLKVSENWIRSSISETVYKNEEDSCMSYIGDEFSGYIIKNRNKTHLIYYGINYCFSYLFFYKHKMPIKQGCCFMEDDIFYYWKDKFLR